MYALRSITKVEAFSRVASNSVPLADIVASWDSRRLTLDCHQKFANCSTARMALLLLPQAALDSVVRRSTLS
jgi:hypothetical protein